MTIIAEEKNNIKKLQKRLLYIPQVRNQTLNDISIDHPLKHKAISYCMKVIHYHLHQSPHIQWNATYNRYTALRGKNVFFNYQMLTKILNIFLSNITI